MAKLVRDQPFIEEGTFSGRFYFVSSWIQHPNHVREAVEKVDVTEDIRKIVDHALREAERERDEFSGLEVGGRL